MTVNFREYFERSHKKENINKLKKIFDLLSRVKGFDTYDFTDNETAPYVFASVLSNLDVEEKLRNLNLGVRIFLAGDEVVYRLQQGSKGFIIGPSRKIEDQKEIESIILQGKTEEEAYNEIFKKIPNQIRSFMTKIMMNLHKKGINNIKHEKDNEIYRNIINSISIIDYDRAVK